MSEKQQRFIMAERQKILQTLCDKIMVYTDGSIILEGLIEVKNSAFVGATARTTWKKKHAAYITFAFDFALT